MRFRDLLAPQLGAVTGSAPASAMEADTGQWLDSRLTFYQTLPEAHQGASSERWREGVWRPGLAPGLPAPGLDPCPKSENRGRYGFSGLTARGRKWVFRAAEVLQRNRRTIALVTFTFPGEVLELLAQGDHLQQVHHRLRQEIGRMLRSRGLPRRFVGVWELQPKRTAREARPAPHLHVLLPFTRKACGRALLTPGDYLLCMTRALATATGYDLCLPSQSVDCEPVRASCSGYLSAYLKKGSGECAEWRGTRFEGLVPRTWWMLSDPLRRDVLGEMRRFNPAFCRWCLSCADGLEQLGLLRAFGVHEVKPVPPGWIIRFLGVEAMAAALDLWALVVGRQNAAASYGAHETPQVALAHVVSS